LNSQSAELAQRVTQMLQEQAGRDHRGGHAVVWTQLQLWVHRTTWARSDEQRPLDQVPLHSGRASAQISHPSGPAHSGSKPPYGSYPHFHTGIDLVEPFGSPVYAADDGIVALVGSSSSGYGNYVVIAHSGA